MHTHAHEILNCINSYRAGESVGAPHSHLITTDLTVSGVPATEIWYSVATSEATTSQHDIVWVVLFAHDRVYLYVKHLLRPILVLCLLETPLE